MLQKDLFHKTIVNRVKKELREEKSPNIIYLWGPIGCGKSTTIDVLCKNWKKHHIDPDHLRKTEEYDMILQNIIHSRGVSKWSILKEKDTSEVFIIDGIQVCEKAIKTFLQTLIEKKVSVTVVIISTSEIKSISLITDVTSIQFPKPSLLELYKLGISVSPDLKKEEMESLIQKSNYDTRQLLGFLQKNTPANEGKLQDFDLQEKIEMIINTKPFNLDLIFALGSSEPGILSNGIFLNYLTTTQIDDCLPSIMDSLSLSDIVSSGTSINNWESADLVTTFGCVIPHYYFSKLPGKLLSSDYISAHNKPSCHLKTPEEIIVQQWIKDNSVDKLISYISSNKLYQYSVEKDTFTFIKIKLPQKGKLKTQISEGLRQLQLQQQQKQQEKQPEREQQVDWNWWSRK